MKTKGVIALGNPFRGDDGISTLLLRKLKDEDMPPNVDLFDAGTGGINVLHILSELDKALIIDAVFFGGDPGDFAFFGPDEAENLKQSRGSHDSNLFEVLELSKGLEELPEEVLLMGIQPKDISVGEGLSKELEEKVPELLRELKEKIGNL